jgi:hypothetical protein
MPIRPTAAPSAEATKYNINLRRLIAVANASREDATPNAPQFDQLE